LGGESVENLKHILTKRGYSERAVEEIMKWYKQTND
jgi:hypothetical protein